MSTTHTKGMLHPNSPPLGIAGKLWVIAKELWCESTPLWFPFLSVALAVMAGLMLDQTVGILQALIESVRPLDKETPVELALANAQKIHIWCFFGGLTLWSFVNFQATRILHDFDYNSPEYAGRLSNRKSGVGWIFTQLEWM